MTTHERKYQYRLVDEKGCYQKTASLTPEQAAKHNVQLKPIGWRWERAY